MNVHRNIDHHAIDARVCITSQRDAPLDCFGFPDPSDLVGLDMADGKSATIAISCSNRAKGRLAGRVVHGYYPQYELNRIRVGELVNISISKVCRIRKHRV